MKKIILITIIGCHILGVICKWYHLQWIQHLIETETGIGSDGSGFNDGLRYIVG